MTQPTGEIVIFQSEDGAPKLEVLVAGETVWLSQQQLADLFQTSRTNIVEHIRNIYAEGELDQGSTCRDFRQVRTEGSRQVARSIPHYNLDLIISVGYRVKSSVATRFRIQATAEYAKFRGRTSSEPTAVERDYFAELRATQKRLQEGPK